MEEQNKSTYRNSIYLFLTITLSIQQKKKYTSVIWTKANTRNQLTNFLIRQQNKTNAITQNHKIETKPKWKKLRSKNPNLKYTNFPHTQSQIWNKRSLFWTKAWQKKYIYTRYFETEKKNPNSNHGTVIWTKKP